jgi:hypothetical protein
MDNKSLSDEQKTKKKALEKQAELEAPQIPAYFRDLVVDFVLRNPEEANRQRLSKEWENQKSKYSPDHLKNIS